MKKIKFKRITGIVAACIIAVSSLSLSGCSFLGDEDYTMVEKSTDGLKYNVPDNFVSVAVRTGNGGTTTGFANSSDPLEEECGLFILTTPSYGISIDTFNWISTGYYTGSVTYMGKTITVDPSFYDINAGDPKDVTYSGFSGTETIIRYKQHLGNSSVSVVERIYLLDLGGRYAAIHFCTYDCEEDKYDELFKDILNNLSYNS